MFPLPVRRAISYIPVTACIFRSSTRLSNTRSMVSKFLSWVIDISLTPLSKAALLQRKIRLWHLNFSLIQDGTASRCCVRPWEKLIKVSGSCPFMKHTLYFELVWLAVNEDDEIPLICNQGVHPKLRTADRNFPRRICLSGAQNDAAWYGEMHVVLKGKVYKYPT